MSEAESPARPRYTLAEYVAREAVSAHRNEFHDGEIVAMAGGDPTHALIQGNVIRALGNAFGDDGPCRTYGADLRIAVPRRRRQLYGDASVICGPVERDPADPSGRGVLNVRAVVEVLSRSTRQYDRTDKFEL